MEDYFEVIREACKHKSKSLLCEDYFEMIGKHVYISQNPSFSSIIHTMEDLLGDIMHLHFLVNCAIVMEKFQLSLSLSYVTFTTYLDLTFSLYFFPLFLIFLNINFPHVIHIILFLQWL